MENYRKMTLEELTAEMEKIDKQIWGLEMSDRMTASKRERYNELYRIKFLIMDILKLKK